jgi:hypothetical protein
MKSSAKSFEIAIPITVAEQVTNKRFPRLQNVAKKVKSGHNSSFEHTSDSTSDESFTSRNRKRKG